MALHNPPGLQAGSNLKLKLRNSRLALPSRMNVRQVMVSPPTVAWSTTATYTGKTWTAAQSYQSYTPTGQFFTFTRCGGIVAGTAFPNYNAVRATNVNYGGGSLNFNAMGVSFEHTGAGFSIATGGYSQNILIKIDDQYVTLTPRQNPNDGSTYYGNVTYAAAGRHRVELIMTSGTNAAFYGIQAGATDTIQPAIVRGPRAIVVGDSFTEGSVATAGAASNYPVIFGELMGWDDVIGSGVGSTGYLATSGNRGTYRSRLATDVIPYNPDVVIFTGSVNDSAFTPAQIAAEAALCFQQVQQALPNALIVCASPFLKGGADYTANFLLAVRPLLKAAVQAVGGLFVDLQQMPVNNGVSYPSLTLSSPTTANGNTVTTTAPALIGMAYQFPDGTTVNTVNARISGSGPYTMGVNNVSNVQAAGTMLTPVGPALWSGNGNTGSLQNNGNSDVFVYSDGTHPTQAGHEAIAAAMAAGLMAALAPN